MRDNCTELRDLAIIDMLASTGMRVGEMVLLNRNDIDFNERECIVFGNQSTYSPKENWQFVNYLDTGNITMNKIDEIQYINTAKDKNLTIRVFIFQEKIKKLF